MAAKLSHCMNTLFQNFHGQQNDHVTASLKSGWLQNDDDDVEVPVPEGLEVPGVDAICTCIFVNKVLYKIKT